MVIGPPSTTQLEKDILEDAARLRGGGVGCACCGGGGNQQASPLEPERPTQTSPPDQTQSSPPQTAQPAKKAPSIKGTSTRAPRLSEPTPPSHAMRARMVSTTLVSAQPSLMPPRAETGRAQSSPTNPSIQPSPSSPPTTRSRYTTLPSKLPPTQQVSSLGPSPTLDGPIHYPGGTIRSPAFPPSVTSGEGSRTAPSGPPPAQAPFMKD